MNAAENIQNSKKLVSIIVPVHNTEKLLRQCLDSLLAQTYPNIEIVCINNLSCDASLSILHDYKQQDTRIQVEDIETPGVSNARNVGFSKASGEYIIFVDSDDQLVPNAVETLLAAAIANNSDVVISSIEGRPEVDWVKDYGTAASVEFTSSLTNTSDQPRHDTGAKGVAATSLSAQDIGKVFFEQTGAFPFIHGKLFTRDLLKRAASHNTNHGVFNTKFDIAEDTLFLFTTLPLAKKITFIPEVTSIYTTVRADSCMSNHNDSAFTRLKVHARVVFEIFSAYENYGIIAENRAQLFNWACDFLYSDASAINLNQKIDFASTWLKLCERFCIEEVLDSLDWRSSLFYELMLVKGAENFLNTPVQNRSPKLSVLIIPENRVYAIDSIKSLLNQSEWNLEIYIWNNCVASGENALYEEFTAKDSRVRLIQTNSALEFLMQSTKMCNSELTLISDSDALYDRDFASLILKQANNSVQYNASILVCATNFDANIDDLSLNSNIILFPNYSEIKLLSFSGTYLANKIFKSQFLHQELFTVSEIVEAENAENTASYIQEKAGNQDPESLKALRILCSLCLLHSHSISCSKDKLLFIPNICATSQISMKLKVEAAKLASRNICNFYKDDPSYHSMRRLLFIAYVKDCNDSMRNCRTEKEFYLLSNVVKGGAVSIFNDLYQNPANYLSPNDFEYAKLCMDLSDCNECDLGKTDTQLQVVYSQLIKLAQLEAKASIDQHIINEHELLLRTEEIERANAIIDRLNTEVSELQAIVVNLHEKVGELDGVIANLHKCIEQKDGIVVNLHEKVAELHGELDHVYNSKRFRIGNTVMKIPDILRETKNKRKPRT